MNTCILSGHVSTLWKKNQNTGCPGKKLPSKVSTLYQMFRENNAHEKLSSESAKKMAKPHATKFGKAKATLH
jgi:hypothetical protein